jgi:ERCC4-type nuclease
MQVKMVIDYREKEVLSIMENIQNMDNMNNIEPTIPSPPVVSTLLRKAVTSSIVPSSTKSLMNRLGQLKQTLSPLFSWEKANLPIGDVHLYTRPFLTENDKNNETENEPQREREWELKVVIERKQGNDLWQSIKDGRWKSQHNRMENVMKNNKNVKVFWVIENFKGPSPEHYIETTWKYITYRLLHNNIHNNSPDVEDVKENASVFWIADVHHFVLFSLCLATQLQKIENKTKFSVKKEEQVVNRIVLPSKQEFTTPPSFLTSVVSAVPGISERVAHLIIQYVLSSSSTTTKENNISLFCEQLKLIKKTDVADIDVSENNFENYKNHENNNESCEGKGNRRRRLGPKKTEKLFKLFFGE